MPESIAGQLSQAERNLIQEAILSAPKKPEAAIEVGTWLGGGSTLHILKALQTNGVGHLWGIECERSVYEQMVKNLESAAPEAMPRFTPLFGLSEEVIPAWLNEHAQTTVDFAFLDGGDNPRLQVREFQLLDPRMPVGARLMAHDARVRKGKWFVPYIQALDHWKSEVLDLSEVGLVSAVKVAERPSAASERAAAALLRGLKRDPAELIARWLPGWMRRGIAAVMPRKLMRQFMRRGAGERS